MKKKLRKQLYISAGCLSAACITILFMPPAIEGMEQNHNAAAYVLAAIFWLGTIAGYVSFIILERNCATIRHKMKKKTHGSVWHNVPAATNPYGLAANIICILAVLLYIISQNIISGSDIWGYVCIFLGIYGIHLSVICNSRGFIYIMNLKDRRVGNHED